MTPYLVLSSISALPVKRDLSDLVSKTKWILSNYDKSLEIAQNAYDFSKKYLTRDYCYLKWNEILSAKN